MMAIERQNLSQLYSGDCHMATTQNEKVRALQRKLYISSKQERSYRFYSLYDKVYRMDVLMEAYGQCRANKGKPGVDGVTFEDIEKQGLQPWLENISDELRNRAYKPQPVKRANDEGQTTITKSTKGTPQGGVVSPLLANIYLNDFSELINAKTPCRMISYADDFVILYGKPYTAVQQEWIKHKLEEEGLTLNERKTRMVDMGMQRAEFDFLGYNFKRVPCFWKKGRWYIKVQPSKKSQKKFKDAIRDIVKHRTSKRLDELIEAVNPIIRGWKNYFAQCGYPKSVFFKMDWFVVGRFYRWAKRLSQRSSKCLTPDALKILRQKGLELFVVMKMSTAKGSM
ncbi:MAG: hypothetical protein CO012_08510 [Syntrophobacterales bacterium CG_4_8_14_3_um_filter_49_14]|nr:MAG: hypothetical protein COX52_13550 [Syntrophobacterales bacterium CG23_combo_of_CG06-09_8_20_14_all_48_27]PJC73692.1 MAG: hypothetical protein CO012_08510 [Syntrophobacterales bacterium CG_4_8_14_3_um_filter_49_14]